MQTVTFGDVLLQMQHTSVSLSWGLRKLAEAISTHQSLAWLRAVAFAYAQA